VAEAHGGHQVFERGVLRVLVELAVGDLGGERLGLEVEAVVVQFDGPGKETLAPHLDGEGGIHGPVGFGSELKVPVVEPGPLAGESRGDGDAGGEALVDVGERRGGFLELDQERVDVRDAVFVVFGKLGGGDGVVDVMRSGTDLVPDDRSGGGCQCQCGSYDTFAVGGQIADRVCPTDGRSSRSIRAPATARVREPFGSV